MIPRHARRLGRPSTHAPAIALVAGLALGALPAPAGAKRIALLDFDGHGRAAVQAAVGRALSGEHELVARQQVATKLRRVGLPSRCRPSEMVASATAIGADALICGSVQGSRRLSTLSLTVYNGGDGKLVKRAKLKVRSGAVNREALQRLVQELGPTLAATWSWEAVEVSSAAAKPAPARLPEARQQAAMPETTSWEVGDGENPLANRARPASVAAAVQAAPSAPERDPRHFGLRLGVGCASLIRRNYGLNEAQTLRDAQGWVTTPVAGLSVGAELYPGAWSSNSWASNLGVAVSYARYFGLTWRMSGDPVEHVATHQVFTADLRGRYRVGSGRRAPELMLRAGYRYAGFSMNDTPELPAVVPDVAFSSLEVGARAELALLPRWLVLSASFDYLPVLSRGEVSADSEYGIATGNGLLFGGGLHGAIAGKFGWRLNVDYSWYTLNFSDEQAKRHADQARDRYLSGALQLTYTN